MLSDIQNEVLTLKIPRYKLVFQIIIYENSDQDVYIASRCLWDVSTDNFATYTYKNDDLICTCMIYGLYLE